MMNSQEWKVHHRFTTFDEIVYYILCIATCGLAYLLRVIITHGVGYALTSLNVMDEKQEQANNYLREITKALTEK